MKYLIVLSFIFNFNFIYSQDYSLSDFYNINPSISNKVDSIFNLLNDTTRIGQMIVPAIGRLGKSRDHVYNLASKGWIGGILLLNGTFKEFTNDVRVFDKIGRASCRERV